MINEEVQRRIGRGGVRKQGITGNKTDTELVLFNIES